jgi:putative ABC transport system permease protein
MMDTLWQDGRYAARSLRRTPGFAAAAIITLALGIGATTSVFTVASATLLTPPPYIEPDRILVLATPDGGDGNTAQEFTFLRERGRTLATISAQRSSPGWTLVIGAHAEFVEGLEVTDGYFETHKVELLLGRGVSRSEAQVGGSRSVVLSEPLWRRLFDARIDVLGEIVELGGRPHVVVGIAPATFQSIPQADIWTPMQIAADSNAGNQRILGRIASGQTRADVLAELNAMRPDFRGALRSPGRIRRVDSVTWMPYPEWMATGTRANLMLVLLGAVGFLLLLACINVAGLQVARGIARVRDFATRAALGAGRSRLIRQAFTESLLVAALGAAAGLAMAFVGTRVMLSLLSQDILTELLGGKSVGIDVRVIAVATLLTFCCAVVFGLVPALSTTAVDLRGRIGQPQHYTASRRNVWLRRAFAIGQIAIAMVLLTGAGLLIRTFVTLRGADLGFNPAGVFVGEMAIQGDRIDPEERNTFIEQALKTVQVLPGVADVAISNRVPVDVAVNLPVRATGQALITDTRSVDWTYVTNSYFTLFEIPVRAGRLFDRRDALGAAPVAVVNEAFARALYGRVNVVGETVQTMGVDEPPRQIVGVVGDTLTRSNAGWTRSFSALGAPGPPIVYVPAAQVSADAFRLIHAFTPMRWIVKPRVSPAAVQEDVRDAVRRVAPRRPFTRFLTMEQIIGRDLDVPRFLTTLLALFAVIALLLAAIGLYALISYLAAQRTREIGIRMAVGATAVRVATNFLREGFALAAAGLVIGVVVAALATRTIAVFLVGVTPLDPPTFAIVAGLLLIVAGLGALGPAIRASRIDPLQALRAE